MGRHLREVGVQVKTVLEVKVFGGHHWYKDPLKIKEHLAGGEELVVSYAEGGKKGTCLASELVGQAVNVCGDRIMVEA